MSKRLRAHPGKLAQSILEYVMLFAIVAAAVTVTYKYVYRSMNARLKNVQDELNYDRSIDGPDEGDPDVIPPGPPDPDPDPDYVCPGGAVLVCRPTYCYCEDIPNW